MDELVDHLAEALEAVDPVVDGLDGAAWSRPVAATGWTAGDLVAHLVDGYRRTAALVREFPVPPLPDPDTDPGALAAYRAAAYDALAALGEPCVLTRSFVVERGSTTGIAAGRALLRETLAHGRDLATATGTTLRIRDRIVALVLDGAPPERSILRPGPASLVIGTGATPLDRVSPGCRGRSGP